MKKTVLIVDNGGRGHALAWKIAQSPHLKKLYVAKGNAGTAALGENVPIDGTNVSDLIRFALATRVDLVIASSDDPLALGIVDSCMAHDIPVFGPTRAAAQLEWSKVFAKRFMEKAEIPTAPFEVFSDFQSAKDYIDAHEMPKVIKADGLALGKGVYVCRTRSNAYIALDKIFYERVHGSAGDKIVIEDFIPGTELSAHFWCNEGVARPFPFLRDRKPAFDGDQGDNTGGMGTYGPIHLPEDLTGWIHEIGLDTISAMEKRMLTPFHGILYPGLILVNGGGPPGVLEYNARPGDTETQTYMRLLKTDLLECIETVQSSPSLGPIEWSTGYAITVVLASEGYPGKYKKGVPIFGLEDAEKVPGVTVFHAGTKYVDEQLVSDGGRILGVSAEGETLEEARGRAYEAISRISCEGSFYRRDIGLAASGVGTT